MERRLSLPEDDRSSGGMQDFSISSIISNVSKLLEGNNSSFLVHVNSSHRTLSPVFVDSRRSSDYEGYSRRHSNPPSDVASLSNEKSCGCPCDELPSGQDRVSTYETLGIETNKKITKPASQDKYKKKKPSNPQLSCRSTMAKEGENFNLADLINRMTKKETSQEQGYASDVSGLESSQTEQMLPPAPKTRAESSQSKQMLPPAPKSGAEGNFNKKDERPEPLFSEMSSILVSVSPIKDVDAGVEKVARIESLEDMEPPEETEEEFLFADIMKGMKYPLPLRRFPPPALSAIFEQSGEDISMSSRSRASSSASSSLKQALEDCKAKSSVSDKDIPNHLTSKPTTESGSLMSSEDLKNSVISRISEMLKRESKIPQLVHVPKGQIEKGNKTESQDFSIFMQPQGKYTTMNYSVQKDSSSFMNWTSGGGQTVLMVGSAEPETTTFSNEIGGIDERPSECDLVNGHSEIASEDVEYQRQNEVDSWDEFDKIMDKSLPPKNWEIHEFEELAQNKSQSFIAEQGIVFDYITSEEAKLLMDKEEEERVQFLKSNDNSFASGRSSIGLNSESKAKDVLSMTNYFQCRSSFPLDNRANDSSMFHDESSRQENKTVQPTTFSSCDDSKEVTIVPSTPENMSSESKLLVTPSFMAPLDSKTKDLARFLVGAESDGIEKSSIMDYVLGICSRRSSCGVANDFTPHTADQNVLREKKFVEPIITQTREKIRFKNHTRDLADDTPNNDYSEAKKLKTGEMSTEQPKMIAGVSKPNKLVKSSEHKRKPQRKLANGSDNNAPTISIRSQDPRHLETELARCESRKGDENSILISEPGKAAFHDDFDLSLGGFDKFKRHLLGGKENRAPVSNKENKAPTSAFVPAQHAAKSVESENIPRRSVDLLRGAATSPPEKLVKSDLPKKTDQHEMAISTSHSKSSHQSPNHSTPITSEPLSVQMARSMRIDGSSQFHNSKTLNEDQSKDMRSAGSNIGIPNSRQGIPKPTRFSSQANGVEKVKKWLPQDGNLMQLRSGSSSRNSETGSLPSTEAGRNYPTKRSSILRSQPLTARIEKDVEEKMSNPNKEDNIKHNTCFESVESSKIQCEKSVSLAASKGIQGPSHTVGSCSQPSATGFFPPSYGFPVSIHIHLPSMPYSFPHTHQQQSQHPHIQPSGMSTGFELPAFQDTCSNTCKCNYCSHVKT